MSLAKLEATLEHLRDNPPDLSGPGWEGHGMYGGPCAWRALPASALAARQPISALMSTIDKKRRQVEKDKAKKLKEQEKAKEKAKKARAKERAKARRLPRAARASGASGGARLDADPALSNEDKSGLGM